MRCGAEPALPRSHSTNAGGSSSAISSRSRSATIPSRNRLAFWRLGRRIRPPPIVTTGPACRMTYRSPVATTTGRSNRNWTNASSPASSRSRSRKKARPWTSSVPLWKRTAAWCSSGLGALGSSLRRASTISKGSR